MEERRTSHGLSTVYLAAATSADDPPVITTEAEPAKITSARENFSLAGVADRIDLRAGDAFETLAHFDQSISLLFLDGWKGLYLPLLRRLEGLPVNGAIVVAADTTLLPDLCADDLDDIRSNTDHDVSSALPVDDLAAAIAVLPDLWVRRQTALRLLKRPSMSRSAPAD
jgi:predicted O-methyltransferase YrrM